MNRALRAGAKGLRRIDNWGLPAAQRGGLTKFTPPIPGLLFLWSLVTERSGLPPQCCLATTAQGEADMSLGKKWLIRTFLELAIPLSMG